MTPKAHRKPFALANWKMAMTIGESLAYAETFTGAVGAVSGQVTTVLCPPFTAMHALSKALSDTAIDIGAQNLFADSGVSHTGEISAPLLTDAGCRWVLLGHWEVRRRDKDSDRAVNKKIHAAFEAGLSPIPMVGEASGDRHRSGKALAPRLSEVFDQCTGKQLSQIALCYEPEWTIGAKTPAPPETIAENCGFMRDWIRKEYGNETAEAIRIIYGGSVFPESAGRLLASPDVDGLGAGRQGRDPIAFARIVREIAVVKRLS